MHTTYQVDGDDKGYFFASMLYVFIGAVLLALLIKYQGLESAVAKMVEEEKEKAEEVGGGRNTRQ